jgi:hypothetical protein
MSAAHRLGPDRTQPLALRASDADREAVVSLLRSHAADGRLDAAELDERVGGALAARSRADLARLVEDLPATGPPPTRSGPSKGWREHLHAYVAVNALLVAIWALSGFGYPWFVWPLLGWGIGLVSHARGRHGPRRRRARTAVEQALGVRGDRLRGGSGGGGHGQPAIER